MGVKSLHPLFMKDTIFLELNPFSHHKTCLSPSPHQPAHQFAFNAQVAAVFDDMISRSVPGYENIQEISAQLAVEALESPCAIYDLGCSTGTSLLRIAQKIKEQRSTNPRFARGCLLIGIDSSTDMIKRAQEKIAAFACADLVTALEGDIRSTDLSDAGVVLSHYTLQFLPPDTRAQVIKTVYQNLRSNGLFIFSEKVRHQSDNLERALTQAHEQFRCQNGYSLVEIIRKREALENVLIPFTLEQNLALLQEAGFNTCEVIRKDLCFVTFLARK
jgi:tRNA (cmo5U34)-methyltransferase